MIAFSAPGTDRGRFDTAPVGRDDADEVDGLLHRVLGLETGLFAPSALIGATMVSGTLKPFGAAFALSKLVSVGFVVVLPAHACSTRAGTSARSGTSRAQ
jgi:hypothetical protein